MEPGNYSEIGGLLRNARQQYGWSIDQVAQTLHIRMRYLEALEQGNLSELPGLAYAKGYLQAYATFLGLDKDEVMRRFQQVEHLLERKAFWIPNIFGKQKAPPRWAIWGGLGAALVMYLLWLVAFQPPRAAISIVEPFPVEEFVQKRYFSAEDAKDVACLQPQDRLYPPCTMAREPEFSLIPPRGQMKSIMELAKPYSKR